MKKKKPLLETLMNQGKLDLLPLKFEKVGVALSGGPDSILLARLLHHVGYRIIALHCNFHLRGEESERDQLFVERFCNSYGIEFKIKHFNVKEYVARNRGTSIEMACRELRYAWFLDKLKELGLDRIATGHNADDNIETFFLNMLRGCGTRGLKGMETETTLLWRPLISLHRHQIIELLNDFEQPFITDSTNLKNDYRRNFLRNEIIPLLRSEWKGFDLALDTTIRNLKSENLVIENLIKEELTDCESLATCKILKFPNPELLIRRFIEDLYPFKTTAFEILDAIKAAKPHERRWKLKKGYIVLRNHRLFKAYLQSLSEDCRYSL